MPQNKSQARKNSSPTVVAGRLHSAAIHLLRRVRKQDVHTGVGPAQLSALSVLVFAGPLTLTELAAAEQVKPPTMSRIVVALERQLLARRRPDPNDRRAIRLHATPKGTCILQQARRRRIQVLVKQLRKLKPADRRTLARAASLIEHMVHASS